MYNPLEGIGKPQVGKRWKIQTLDVDVFAGRPKLSAVFAQIAEREAVEHRGNKVSAYRVDVYKALDGSPPLSQVWINEEGEVLIEQMKVYNLSCRIVLVEKRILTPQEVADRIRPKE
jgi:hypothetical protein